MHRHLAFDLPQSIPASPAGRLFAAPSMDRIVGHVATVPGWATAPFNTFTLSSIYQPILSVADRNIAGHEGLLLATNLSGQQVPAPAIFSMAGDLNESNYLDLLARALHLKNFRDFGAPGKLYLNVFPEAANEDLQFADMFRQLIDHYGVAASSIVIEILESGVRDEARLMDAVQLYRDLGCQIALDDFGTGFSNMERLWRLQPDIVKIDRSVMRSAAADARARRVLKNMVKMIHECGAAAVIEGVEERDDALIALETDADFLQGFYFARPGRERIDSGAVSNMFSMLMHQYENGAELTRVKTAATVRQHAWVLENMAAAMERGNDFDLAAEALLKHPRTLRAYLLALDGQLIASRLNLRRLSAADAQEQRCIGGLGWQLQHMLTAVTDHPGVVHVTRPWLPEHGSDDCVTLSFALEVNGEQRVLCCDFLWEDMPEDLALPN